SKNTPKLTCILVDDVNASNLSTWQKDAKNTFVASEAECRAKVLSTNTYDLNSSIEMFPNPVTDMLTLKLNNSNSIKKVKTYTVLGKLVSETTSKNINFSEFSDGIYIVKVITEKGIITRKVIKK
ncbi:T9SS type A sorting domain-containing protein, partial [Polaribacter haliotis]